jgi:phosphotransferase system enzyme I (PtsI)
VSGRLAIMFPMISSLGELRQAKALLDEARLELRSRGIKFADKIEVGMMIEIPSAALISDVLAKEVDFFSIGTNDLIQYTCAVDRMNQNINELYDAFHPGVLRLIDLVVKNGKKAGIWVGMCGEMAGTRALIPLLVGLGLDELSMSPSSVLRARKMVRSIDTLQCKELARQALDAPTGEAVKKLCEAFS